MEGFIIFVTFFLLPFISTFIVRAIDRRWKWLTYCFTTILGLFFPIFLVQIGHFFNPPPPGPRCGMPEFGLMMSGWIFGVPTLLFIQMIINLYYSNKDRVPN
jgi:hypothetical protein